MISTHCIGTTKTAIIILLIKLSNGNVVEQEAMRIHGLEFGVCVGGVRVLQGSGFHSKGALKALQGLAASLLGPETFGSSSRLVELYGVARSLQGF